MPGAKRLKEAKRFKRGAKSLKRCYQERFVCISQHQVPTAPFSIIFFYPKCSEHHAFCLALIKVDNDFFAAWMRLAGKYIAIFYFFRFQRIIVIHNNFAGYQFCAAGSAYASFAGKW